MCYAFQQCVAHFFTQAENMLRMVFPLRNSALPFANFAVQKVCVCNRKGREGFAKVHKDGNV